MSLRDASEAPVQRGKHFETIYFCLYFLYLFYFHFIFIFILFLFYIKTISTYGKPETQPSLFLMCVYRLSATEGRS